MHAPISDEASGSVRPWWVSPCRLLWKVFGALGTVVLVPLVVNVLSTWLTSSKGIIPADSPFAEIVARWQLTLAVSSWLFLLAILTFVLSRWPVYTAAVPSLQKQQNRAYMLQRLRYSYGELMAQSLQGFAWLELGLAHRPNAVQNAATLLLRQSNQPERMLPSGTSIVQVYEEAKQELLIRKSRHSRFLRRKNATEGTDGEREQASIRKSRGGLIDPFTQQCQIPVERAVVERA